MKLSSWMLWRIGLSWLVSVVVALAALSSVANVGRIETYSQDRTRRALEKTAKAIDEHRRRTGSLPSSLNGLSAPLKDGWRNPFLYRRRGSSYRLISLGEDGRPGGTGLSCDLSSDDPSPPESRMTWWQMMSLRSALPVLLGAALCGALAFAHVFSSIKEPASPPSAAQIAALLPGLLVTAAFACLIALFVGSLDVPSGH